MKKTLIILGGLLVPIAGILLYIHSLQPTYEGTLELEGLQQETNTYFDEFGIPHIYAENPSDAMTTLGYVHAQDRLWQMELLRRIAPGRLSEIFGEKALRSDAFFLSLGIEEASAKSVASLDKNSPVYELTTAYIKGINQFIEQGPSPVEFILLGIEKEPFTIEDVHHILGYMAFSFAMAHKTDPLVNALYEKLGAEYLEDLDIDSDPKSTLIQNTPRSTEGFDAVSAQVAAIVKDLPVPAFVGSNSWVVSGAKTRSGKVLFANDPHIGYAQPSVWYEAHVHCPGYEMYGYHLAGVPFPLLGHNRQYAYGVTMLENDDIDFYKEESHPTDSTAYKIPTGYANFTHRLKTIQVKGAEAVNLKIRHTRHGPLVNDVIGGLSKSEPIAMSWIYTQLEGKLLEALYHISRAKTLEDVKKGAAMIHAPGLNMMYGDALGNIAWWAAGKLYRYNEHVNRKLILEGASGKDDLLSYLDFSDNPMAENPPWNYVYSANNQPDSIAGLLYPGYYLPEDRAKRIVELLEPKNDWDKTAFTKMITDVTSSVAPSIVQELIKAGTHEQWKGTDKEAWLLLKNWDGSNSLNQTAPTIYNKWVYLYLKNTFEDELGEEWFKGLLPTHLMKRTIAQHLKNDRSVWWDDLNTSDKTETKNDILLKSFKETVAALREQLGDDPSHWQWGKVHTLEHEHALGKVALLKSFLNVGTFSMNGAREVIDNRGYDYDDTGVYPVKNGPSTRRVVDFSDVENSVSILPTGQSGNPFSKHYKDQAGRYAAGEFRKMKLNKNEIVAVSSKLTAKPKDE